MEAAAGTKYNFSLVGYYVTSADSISFHSDDERFLGPGPVIASFSLGSKCDYDVGGAWPLTKDVSGLGHHTTQARLSCTTVQPP
jgi:alkylated DNA repair dioxygenase AlkB